MRCKTGQHFGCAVFHATRNRVLRIFYCDNIYYFVDCQYIPLWHNWLARQTVMCIANLEVDSSILSGGDIFFFHHFFSFHFLKMKKLLVILSNAQQLLKSSQELLICTK